MSGNEIAMRIFVVGMARSGTTLVQSIINGHSKSLSFPETHFLSKTIYLPTYLRFLPIRGSGIEYVNKIFQKIGIEDLLQHQLRWSKSKFVREVCAILDQYALQKGYSLWVEKTPLHLLYIKILERSLNNLKFIHVIREPVANINSLLKASKQHGEYFAQDTLKKAIDRYNRDTAISKTYVNNSNHYFVSYNQLVNNPVPEIKSIAEFIGLPFEKEMLNFQNSASELILKEESWKSNNVRRLDNMDSPNILSEMEQQIIKNKTATNWSFWLKYFDI